MSEQEPMFSCQNEGCATEISYPADMLAMWNDRPICEACFEDGDYNLEQRWFELPKFVPAMTAERDRLRAQNAAMLEALKAAQDAEITEALTYAVREKINAAIAAAEQEPDNG